MDSSNGTANYKLQAIKDAIKNGILTKEEISRRLTYAISEEYQKDPAIRDNRFILACEKILYEMHTGKSYVSRKEESKKALIERLERKAERHSIHIIRKAWRVVVVACALVVLIIGADIVLHREWLRWRSTFDEQQYVVQGQSVDPGLMTESYAANGQGNAELTTTDLNELISFLGYEPTIPIWLPDELSIENYYASVMSDETIIRVHYSQNSSEDEIVYTQISYSNAEDAYSTFEQNEEGNVFFIESQIVYQAENMHRPRYNWIKGNNAYSLAGILNEEAMKHMIQSTLGESMQ